MTLELHPVIATAAIIIVMWCVHIVTDAIRPEDDE